MEGKQLNLSMVLASIGKKSNRQETTNLSQINYEENKHGTVGKFLAQNTKITL